MNSKKLFSLMLMHLERRKNTWHPAKAPSQVKMPLDGNSGITAVHINYLVSQPETSKSFKKCKNPKKPGCSGCRNAVVSLTDYNSVCLYLNVQGSTSIFPFNESLECCCGNSSESFLLQLNSENKFH